MRGETAVHISVRKYLKENGWSLIAGQFPGGSDDELLTLYVVDPELARDNSPDHRRHSSGKFVPDLVAIKDDRILIVEAKPEYSNADKEKLDSLINDHIDDFNRDLSVFLNRNRPELMPIENYRPVPCLAFFESSRKFPIDDRFVYILVEDLDNAKWFANKEAV